MRSLRQEDEDVGGFAFDVGEFFEEKLK